MIDTDEHDTTQKRHTTRTPSLLAEAAPARSSLAAATSGPMAATTTVSVLLYPRQQRVALGFKQDAPQLVLVPTGPDGTRHMLVSSLLQLLAKQQPKFAPYWEVCHVARGSETDRSSELLARDAYLNAGDHVAIHIIPGAPEDVPPTQKKRQATKFDRLSKPLALTLCDYQPPHGWPTPLPPTSVLLADAGFAHDHAMSKLLLSGTKCFWVIPGCILAGPAPTSDGTIRQILDAGVRSFVDLRATGEGEDYSELVRHQYAEMVAKDLGGASIQMDRSEGGSSLMPPRPDAPEFIKMATPQISASQKMIYHPTQSRCDHMTLTDPEVSENCAYLLRRCHEHGNKFYVHCSGGHFRTGTLCSVLIGLAYELSGHHAILLFQALHDMAGNVFDRNSHHHRSPTAGFRASPLGASPRPTSGPGSPTAELRGRADHAQSFASQAAECRALFPEQRVQVVRLLAPVRDYVRSSTVSSNLLREYAEEGAEEGFEEQEWHGEVPELFAEDYEEELAEADEEEKHEKQNEMMMVREITRARSRIHMALGNVAESPLVLKRRSLERIGTLATVTSSVVDDIKNLQKPAFIEKMERQASRAMERMSKIERQASQTLGATVGTLDKMGSLSKQGAYNVSGRITGAVRLSTTPSMSRGLHVGESPKGSPASAPVKVA